MASFTMAIQSIMQINTRNIIISYICYHNYRIISSNEILSMMHAITLHNVVNKQFVCSVAIHVIIATSMMLSFYPFYPII